MEREAEAKIKAGILEAEKHAKVAREWIERSRRAGIDVSEQERKQTELEGRLSRMRAVFIEGK